MNEYKPDLVTLADENGKNTEFEILDIIDYDESQYYILSPFHANPADVLSAQASCTVFEVEEANGVKSFAVPEDEALIRKISIIFEERYNHLLFED